MLLTDQEKKLAQESLDEDDAQIADRYEGVHAPNLGDAELSRTWPELTVDHIPLLLQYLEDRKFIDNPKANGEVYEGRWRSAYVRRVVSGDVTTIVEVLRRGYNEEVKWDEARLIDGNAFLSNDSSVSGVAQTISDNPGRVLRILFPNISPKSVRAVSEAIRAATIVDPVIRGETHSGTWHVMGVLPKTMDDGSCEISVSLALPQYTLNAYEGHGIAGFNSSFVFGSDVAYLYGVPRNIAQVICDDHKADGRGRSVRSNASTDPSLIDLILYSSADTEIVQDGIISDLQCEATVTTDQYWNVADVDGAGLVLGVAPYTTGDGISYTKRWREASSGGLFDVTITTRRATKRDQDPYLSEESVFSEVTRNPFFGYTQAEAESKQAELAAGDGQIVRQRWDLQGDCSVDGFVDQDEGINVDDDISYEKNAFEAIETTREISAVAADPEPSLAEGEIVEIEQRKSQYKNRHDIQRRTRTAERDVAAGSQTSENVFESEEVEEISGTSELGPAARVDGVIVERQSRKSLFGIWDTTERVRTASPDVAAGEDYDEDVFGRVTSIRTANKEEPSELPTLVTGTASVRRSSRNPFGWYDVEEVDEEATADVDLGTDEVRTAFEIGTTEKTRHASVQEPHDDLTVDGSIVELRHTKDIFGYYEKSKETREAITVGPDMHVSEASSERTITEEEWFNATTIPNADDPEVDVGTRVRVVGRRNIFNRFDYVRYLETEIPPFAGTLTWTLDDPDTFRVASLATGQEEGVWYTRIAGYSVYRYRYTYSMKWFDNAEDAKNFIDGFSTGSSFNQRGLLWVAVKVEVSAVSA